MRRGAMCLREGDSLPQEALEVGLAHRALGEDGIAGKLVGHEDENVRRVATCGRCDGRGDCGRGKVIKRGCGYSAEKQLSSIKHAFTSLKYSVTTLLEKEARRDILSWRQACRLLLS